MPTPKAPKLDKKTHYFIQYDRNMSHINEEDLLVLVAGIDKDAKQIGICNIIVKGALVMLDMEPHPINDYVGPVIIWKYAPGSVVGYQIRKVGRVEPFYDAESKRVGCTYERVLFVALEAEDALKLEFANQVGKLGLDK